MPEEVIIVAIVFGTVAAIVWMILNFNLRVKERERSAKSDSAVGVRELEERIREAVESGTEPLRLQVAQLEEAIRSNRALPDGETEGRLLRSHEEQ